MVRCQRPSVFDVVYSRSAGRYVNVYDPEVAGNMHVHDDGILMNGPRHRPRYYYDEDDDDDVYVPRGRNRRGVDLRGMGDNNQIYVGDGQRVYPRGNYPAFGYGYPMRPYRDVLGRAIGLHNHGNAEARRRARNAFFDRYGDGDFWGAPQSGWDPRRIDRLDRRDLPLLMPPNEGAHAPFGRRQRENVPVYW